MAARSPVVRVAAARAGAAARNGNPERIEQTRRDLAAARLEDYIRRVVEQAPPLTDEQRARLRVLLAPSLATARPERAA